MQVENNHVDLKWVPIGYFLNWKGMTAGIVDVTNKPGLKLPGSCYKRQKPQAPTPQAPIRNHQTRKVANAKGLNRNTNLTWPNLT